MVVRGGNEAGDHQLPHAEAGEGRALLREDLRADEGLRVLLRQVQARPLQGHRLRQVRRRSRAQQGAPRAHGPHRAGVAGEPHLVREGHAQPLGLLLDISPRKLERVLYFAQYIVTTVDEHAKKRALDHLQRGDGHARRRAREKEYAERVQELRDQLRRGRERRTQADRERKLAAARGGPPASRPTPIMQTGRRVRGGRSSESIGKSARKGYRLGDDARRRARLGHREERTSTALKKVAQERVARARSRLQEEARRRRR